MKNTTPLIKWASYAKDKNLANEGALKGEIYEYYCYDKILRKYNNISIIRAKDTDKTENKSDLNGFYYNDVGQIIYKSSNIDLGEFDVLGLNGNNIFWWEITLNNSTTKNVKKRIERKKELFQKIFPNNKLCLHLILPEKYEAYNSYSTVLIPEPNYELFFKPTYTFENDLNKCINLSELVKFSVPYNHIQNIISTSEKYFRYDKTQYNSTLLERLYDIKNINKNSFFYYDLENHKLGNIELNNESIKKDGKAIEKKKATYKEIIGIREYLKHL
ncbi:MAG: hypothetical protein IJ630_09555 [Treponema sp.]|nr:hypothetical protein [Treponema sp.]